MTGDATWHSSPRTADRPWRAWEVGARVVVRRRLAPGSSQPYTDVLGELTAVDDAGVDVLTRRGPVHVPAADIALGKVVPPAPARRRARPAPD